MSKQQVLLLFTAAWVVIVVLWALYYVESTLAQGPFGDLYANEPSFQYLTFAIFRLPIALVLYAVGISYIVRRTAPATAEGEAHVGPHGRA